MYETPSTHPQAGIPTCDRCGERPGRVRMVFANGARRGEATLCQLCAQELMARGGDMPAGGGFPGFGGAVPGFGPQAPRGARGARGARGGAGRGGSQTPALDEFGRDLTAEAAEGRIDPVIGRDDEIEQAVEILARRRSCRTGPR
jgi:ATP-dependent Clp protease ATP-binding subunit ClpC